MKTSFTLSLLLGAVFTALAAMGVQGANLEGAKCECFGGDATCFFDGSRCPVSGDKCKCFKSPGVQGTERGSCCCGNQLGSPACSKIRVEFCSARCSEEVGGETCRAQCRLESGHSGQHLCIKLHDF